jgi:hypothetical protein
VDALTLDFRAKHLGYVCGPVSDEVFVEPGVDFVAVPNSSDVSKRSRNIVEVSAGRDRTDLT